MNHSHTSNPRNRLVKQLAFFDEQMPYFLNSYPVHEKVKMQKSISQYTNKLEKLLEFDDVTLSEALSKITVIGNSVRICYEEEGSHEIFTVVLPNEIDPDQNKISLFSPIGNQLLWRSTGEAFILHTPAAQHSVRILETAFD